MTTPSSIEKLTGRQREILRLIKAGHTAKSAASELGISFHTVNEHLAEARKQLGVTNSRLAARMLASFEGDTPIYKGPNEIGVAIPGRHEPKPRSTLTRFRLKFEGGFIMAGVPPIVVSTSPADGSIIAPGPFDLTVTFDRAMLEGSYSFVQVSPETFPDCTPGATLSADGMSYTMLCTATAGREYEVWFNRPPYMNFKSIDGISAQPHRIRFRSE